MKYRISETSEQVRQKFYYAVDKNTEKSLRDKRGKVVVSSNKELLIAYIMGTEGLGLA